METSQYQKWVNLSYLAVAGLVIYITFTAGQYAVGAYDLESRVRNIELILQGGFHRRWARSRFLVLYRHEQANQFMNEVMTELTRVTWPTQKETSNGDDRRDRHGDDFGPGFGLFRLCLDLSLEDGPIIKESSD